MSGLHSGQCGLTDGSAKGAWRLPTLAEWQGIVKADCYPSQGVPTLPDKAGTGCYATGTQWATGVLSSFYWSSTTYAADPTFGGDTYLYFGYIEYRDKIDGFYVWPVRRAR